MDYYEYHYLVSDLAEHLKKEQDANKQQNESVSAATSGFKSPTMPKMPTIRTPSL